jgi:hypothetical protein
VIRKRFLPWIALVLACELPGSNAPEPLAPPPLPSSAPTTERSAGVSKLAPPTRDRAADAELLRLVRGGAALQSIPVQATDPGVAFIRTLRDELVPRQKRRPSASNDVLDAF